MNNHYHLLVSERADGGLTKFVRRLNIGYANYFNERHKRHGALFQGRTKKVWIETDAHFLHILNYIHSNPLDLMREGRGWRDKKLPNAVTALQRIEKYKWSSYLDYIGHKNFPSILTTELFSDIFKDYKKELLSFLSSNEIQLIRNYNLEY